MDKIILGAFIAGAFVTLFTGSATFAAPSYRLLKTKTDPKVYLVVNNRRAHIPTEAAFIAGGYKWSEIETVSARDLAQIPMAEEFVFDLGELGVEYTWSKARMTDFKKYRVGTLGGVDTTITDVSDRGTVVGYSEISGTGMDGGNEHAFLWKKKKMVDLGTLGGRGSKAFSVNNQDEVVGCSQIKKEDKNCYPFVWRKGKLRQLGSGRGSAHDVNDSGFIVGEKWPWAHRWSDRGEEKLAVPNSSVQTIAKSINNKGDIVGRAMFWFSDSLLEKIAEDNKMPDLVAEAYSAKAVLWRNGKVYDMSKLLPAETGVRLSDAVDINDNNQVVVRGFRVDSYDYRIFLVALPETLPATAVMDVSEAGLKGKIK